MPTSERRICTLENESAFTTAAAASVNNKVSASPREATLQWSTIRLHSKCWILKERKTCLFSHTSWAVAAEENLKVAHKWGPLCRDEVAGSRVRRPWIPPELISLSPWRALRDVPLIMSNGLQALKIARGTDRNYALHACASHRTGITVVQCELCQLCVGWVLCSLLIHHHQIRMSRSSLELLQK